MKKFVALMVCVMFMTSALVTLNVAASKPVPEKPTANDVLNVNTGIHYGTIGLAIMAAATIDGHTLLISPGVYPEQLNVNKRLILQGMDRTSTIIDGFGGSSTLVTQVSGINISGVTITNASGWGIQIGTNCRLNDSIVQGNHDGLYVLGKNTTLRNNLIRNNSGSGITMANPTYGNYTANQVTNNSVFGIALQGSYISVRGNIVSGGEWGIGVLSGVGFIVDGNTISNSSSSEVYIGSGANRAVIKNNILKGGAYTGFYISSTTGGKNCTIYHNKVINNNPYNAYILNNFNFWNSSYPTGGNYWGDYAGIDVMRGPNQDIPGSDGIGDTPYNLGGPGGAVDYYPLMDFLDPRAPIRINSNADFNPEHGVSSGNGSASNPWVIQRYDINATGQGCGIFIGNTTDYFVIKDCYVHHSSGYEGDMTYYYFPTGIFLRNVTNAALSGNTISNNTAGGIHLWKSPIATISDNEVRDNWGYAATAAILIEANSNRSSIVNNRIVNNNNSGGVEIGGSSNNTFRGNDIIGNAGDGMYLYKSGSPCNDNIIVNNNISANVGGGIYIGSITYWNRIYLNTFDSNNGGGVQAWDSVSTNNYWNATYPLGGNYWSTLVGTDVNHGATTPQALPGADGFNDTSFKFGPAGRFDYYPLMKPPVDGKVVRPPFRINANADFAGWGFPGTGSKANPWIIDGYDINGTGKGYCIYVGNTSQYFTISNCTTYNATGYTNSPWYVGAAIHIRNVIHGTVRGSNASGNDYAGIYLYASNYCDIVKNEAWREKTFSGGSGSGIWISGGSLGCNVTANNLGWSRGPGIRVDDSRRTNISFNNVSYNNQANGATGGIYVSSYSWQSNNHTLWGNDITHNPIYGVQIYGDNDTVIQSNDILFNCGGTAGLYSNLANRLTIDNNNISNGTGFGILIDAMRNSTLTNNIVSSNYNGGVYFYNNCHDNRISSNDISGNGVSGSGDGFYAYHSNRNTFDNNSFSSNPNSGLAFFECSGNRIFRNDFIGNFVMQGYDYNGANFWNATYPVGGNFWSDYAGIDVMHGPYPQSLAGPDGMGEAFEPTSGPGTPDYYPLMQSIHTADIIPPNSNVDPITPYFRSTSPLTITATATDLDGVANVTLWYRYSADNITWGSWTRFGLNGSGSWWWGFTFPSGEGWYQFFSIANDIASNTEPFKAVAEASCSYDISNPSCTIGWTTPYWRNGMPITLTATASDAYSGVHEVQYWYYYSTDNATWGIPYYIGAGTTDPLCSYDFYNSTEGYYRFYANALDCSGYWGTSGYAHYAVDMTNPVSSIDALPQYWYSTTPLALTATASDALSGVLSVALWFRYSTDNATWGSWTFAQTDSTLPWAYSFDFNLGNGYYEFQSRATDKANNQESLAGTADARYGYDSTAPSSSANYAAPYWLSGSPLGLDATVSGDLNPIAYVELWYRYASDNTTWGAWTNFSADTLAPWQWFFPWLDGEGYYQFYTRASDSLGNYEPAPGVADARWAYDSTAPASSATAAGPYSSYSTSRLINATTTEALSGLLRIGMYYRFSTDNATWSPWKILYNLTAAPWSWGFPTANGTGYYEFYTRATDNAGNSETPPAVADIRLRLLLDAIPPASSVNAIAGYWRTSSPLTMTATATDDLSGVKNVTLWFRSSTNNATWAAWMSYETDTTSPWSWSFNFPNGSAFYEFYTMACDNASNEESAPSKADAYCAYDAVKPTIQDDSAFTATTGEPFVVTATVQDNMALDRVYLIYWIGAGAEVNISISGNPRTFPILMPSNSQNVLHYRISAVDLAGNWILTATRNVPVSDNDPPVAVAGADQIVEAGTSVTFNATGSTDNIGIINYTWAFTHNGTTITLHGATPVFTFWENANHTVTLLVRDGAGFTDTDTVNVLVWLQTFSPPVANAGSDATIDYGQTITFDGSGSTDDVGITNYTWSFTYNGTSRTLFGQTPSFQFFADGDYTVTLTVMDSAGNAATDTVLVHVNSPEQPIGGEVTDYWWIIIIIIAASIVALYFVLKKFGDKGSQAEHDDESDDEDDGDDESTEPNEDEPLTAQQSPTDVQSLESPPK